jgi:ribosomal protein S18 acetylase RimI-like enzyme
MAKKDKRRQAPNSAEMAAIEIYPAEFPADLAAVRELFEEYAEWLDYEMSYANIAKELADLPGGYGPPGGNLLVAWSVSSPFSRRGDQPEGNEIIRPAANAAGCVALRGWRDEICEMKRLYIRPQYRGLQLGRRLSLAIIAEARKLGYKRMRLDTLPERMGPAIALYKSIGFREIPKYRPSPTEDALYLELVL